MKLDYPLNKFDLKNKILFIIVVNIWYLITFLDWNQPAQMGWNSAVAN